MNEHETNPQRPVAHPDEDPPQRTEELPRDAAQPQWGQSGPAAQEAGRYWAPQPAASSAPGAPAASAAPGAPVASPASAAPAALPAYGAPADSPQAESGAALAGAAPTTAPPYQGGHWQQPQYPQHQAWSGPAGYAAPGYPPHQDPTQQHLPHHDPTQQHLPHHDPGQQNLPPWAQPVAGPTQARPSRVGKFVALGVAALLLALSAGGIGAWTALALDDDGNDTFIPLSDRSLPAAPAKVLDRSSLAQIAAAVQDSVVSIKTGRGEGSGVVLSADGFVLSNNHVVANAAGGTVDVIFANGKSAKAKIVGTDPRTDLAVVKADDVSGLSPAKLGDSAAMQVGDTVLALGSPLGLQGSVTAGIISAKDRTIQAGGEQENPLAAPAARTSMSGLLQTDAPINPGNSGGALVNTNGEVIGINTAIATNGQGQGNIGVGFAIPSNRASQVAQQLMKGEKVSHPVLGVTVTAAEGGGALVRTVTPDGPAAKAGLQAADVITEVNGKPVNDSDDVVAIVQGGKVGDQLQMTYTRNGAKQNATATLAEAP